MCAAQKQAFILHNEMIAQAETKQDVIGVFTGRRLSKIGHLEDMAVAIYNEKKRIQLARADLLYMSGR